MMGHVLYARAVGAHLNRMTKTMRCPNCSHDNSIKIDFTPEYNSKKPYEMVCYNCGWFSKRFKTKEEAIKQEDKNDES